MKNLPEQTRQALADFLMMSSQNRHAADALSGELLDSIALKNCLLETPRS